MLSFIARAAVAACMLIPSCVAAEEFEFKTEEFAPKLSKQFKSIGEKVVIKKKSCGEQARAVCTYEVGNFALMMVGGPKISGPADEVTFVCAAAGDVNKAASCLLGNIAIIMTVSPNLSKEDRGNILGAMSRVLGVSKETRIKTEDVEFIMQNLGDVGLWFHAKAI